MVSADEKTGNSMKKGRRSIENGLLELVGIRNGACARAFGRLLFSFKEGEVFLTRPSGTLK